MALPESWTLPTLGSSLHKVDWSLSCCITRPPDRITNLTPCADATEQSFFGCRSSSWHRATLQPLPCPASSSASREKRTLGLGVPLRPGRERCAVENSVTTTHPASQALHPFSQLRLLVWFVSSPVHTYLGSRGKLVGRQHLDPTAPRVAANKLVDWHTSLCPPPRSHHANQHTRRFLPPTTCAEPNLHSCSNDASSPVTLAVSLPPNKRPRPKPTRPKHECSFGLALRKSPPWMVHTGMSFPRAGACQYFRVCNPSLGPRD